MYEFTELELCQEEFNNLLFMNPPREWHKKECPELPFEEEHEFLFDLCSNPLKEVVKKVIKRSGLKEPKIDPTEVFESMQDVKARNEDGPWFESHALLSKHFNKKLMDKLWIRNPTHWQNESGEWIGEKTENPECSFYITDGNHRALVYAMHIACSKDTYEPVKALHATSWDIASGILGWQPQPAHALEHNGKLKRKGKSHYYKDQLHMHIRLLGSS